LVGDQVGSAVSVGDDFSVVTSVVGNATETVGVIIAAIFAETKQKTTDIKFIYQKHVLNYYSKQNSK
jgi:predicted RecA/RadA family phage recombinase